jgi:putative membrane protein
LLLYGLAGCAIAARLAGRLVKIVAGPLIRNSSLRKLAHWLVTPVVAWLAMNVTLLAWHVPSAYDFALEHEVWHAVEHLCFLVSSLLFWWCVIRPWPAERLRQNWGILLYLVAADIVNTLLSAFLAFCGRPVYTFYLTNPNPFQVSPADDQVLGAVIMWVFGSIVFLLPAMLITLQLTGMQSGGRVTPR